MPISLIGMRGIDSVNSKGDLCPLWMGGRRRTALAAGLDSSVCARIPSLLGWCQSLRRPVNTGTKMMDTVHLPCRGWAKAGYWSVPFELKLDDIQTSSGFGSTKISLHFPEHVARLAESEAALLHVTVSGLLRRLLRWNAGTSPGRPSDSPQRSLPVKLDSGKKRKLQMRLEDEDYIFLKRLCAISGLNNSGVLSILLLRWLEIDPMARGAERY